jgi:hypothetical protein
MSKKHKHYMVDCFDRDGKMFASFPIRGITDDESAIREATIAEWRNPTSYRVRAVSRKGEREIFNSADKRVVPQFRL